MKEPLHNSYYLISLTSFLLKVANLSLYAVAFVVFKFNTKGSIIDVESQVYKLLICFGSSWNFLLGCFLISL